MTCVDSGFDIHLAGAAGLDIKGTEVPGHVSSRSHLQMGQAGRHPEIRRQATDDPPRRKPLLER